MITTLDDYAIHQTSLPLIVPATSDRNFHDRFRFNGFAGDTPVFARDTGEVAATLYEYQLDYLPGTRRLRHAVVRYRKPTGEMLEVDYEPLVTFQMAGLGYGHPEWGHGYWKGGYAIGEETWRLDELDITQPHLFHVQQVCRTTLNGGQQGCGIFEHVAIGPHAPSGFHELCDLYQPP